MKTTREERRRAGNGEKIGAQPIDDIHSHLLPRCCRLWRKIITAFAVRQVEIGQPLSNDAHNRFQEPASIAVLALIEAESLLVQIPEQMKRLHIDVCATERPLEQRPKVLKAVGVDASANIGLGVVNDAVHKRLGKVPVGRERVRVDFRTRFNHVADARVDLMRFAVPQHLERNPRMVLPFRPFQHAHNGCFADNARAPNVPLPSVHVAGLGPDEGLIRFDFTPHLGNGTVLHGEPDAMEHEPSGFLRDAKSLGQFIAADPVLGVNDQPHGRKPLVVAKGAILKDRPNLGRKLFMADHALPLGARRNKRDPLGLAMGADNNPVWPAKGAHELKPFGWVSKICDGLLERLRELILVLHVPNL